MTKAEFLKTAYKATELQPHAVAIHMVLDEAESKSYVKDHFKGILRDLRKEYAVLSKLLSDLETVDNWEDAK